VFGDTPNVAARVQGAAERNTVVVSAAVHQLVSGLFVVEDRGAQTLKGISQPLQLYRVIQPTPARRQTHRAASATQAPFVGRDDEMRLLLSRWERARRGEGQLALVVGEPGIGKSRLIEEFRALIKDEPHLWIECAGEQFSANTPFHAIIQILDQGLGWRGDESKEERVVQLQRALDLAGMKLSEAVPLVAEMLNLPIPEKYPPLMFAPEQKRRRLLANLAQWVLNVARLQPAIIVLEDLHWVDPSTLELMQTLVEQAATSPLLLLYTARPEFRAPWPMRAHHVQITLNRLSERHTREMIAGLAARTALAKEVIDAVVKRTDGVPLFAEELTRLMLEGDGRRLAREIPVTLHDSLMARLDRLGPAKEVAQVGAVLGREFSYELLQAVSLMPEAELQAALTKLTDAELIYARGIAPEAQYQFKHALIQDAAYEALLKSRRKELHASIAQALTDKFVALAESQPATVARHWTHAGRDDLAVPAWQKVGDTTRARQAFREAEEAYRQALAILENQPDSGERDARELKLRSALGEVLQITKGYASAEAFQAKTRARVLAERSGNLAQLVIDLLGAWIAATTSGDHAAADGVAERMLELAEREGSAINRGLSHMAKLCTCYYRGDFLGCDKYFIDGRRFFDAPDFRKFRGAVSNTFGLADLNAWTLGHPETARARLQHALSAARENESAYDLAFALHQESNLQMLLGKPALAEAAAAQALALSDEHGFPYFGATCQIALGSARAHLGQVQPGIGLIRRGLTEMARNGTRNFVPRYLCYLAAAQASDGALAEAFSSLSQALEANPQELLYRPEALRLRGEVQLAQGQTERAAADFREALSLAKGMSAKGWELRATVSLARLLRDTNRRDEARAMLTEIYNWFTEGFDTADLKDAKALQDELSA
jgi:predicted ATPase